MENMSIYNQMRTVPQEAKKPIGAGRLKGMTDINPMWRIKRLTEVFGPCGIGWYTEIKRQWTEQGAEGEVMAFCNIDLFVKADGEWSKPIPGTGGSMLIAKERSGLHSSDEAYKMAYTDALSVAAKALGVAADVYYDKDRTKYDQQPDQQAQQPLVVCNKCGRPIAGRKSKDGQMLSPAEVKEQLGGLCVACYREQKGA